MQLLNNQCCAMYDAVIMKSSILLIAWAYSSGTFAQLTVVEHLQSVCSAWVAAAASHHALLSSLCLAHAKGCPYQGCKKTLFYYKIKQFYFSLPTDGIGKMEYTTGDVYHGEWNMGDMHGQVIIEFIFFTDLCSCCLCDWDLNLVPFGVGVSSFCVCECVISKTLNM